MKISAIPFFCLLALPMLLEAARPANAANKFESECVLQAGKLAATQVTAATIANYMEANTSKSLVAIDYLKLNANHTVPVLTFQGPTDATLIVLIHNKAGSTTETPDIDAICHDQNHNFIIDKPNDSIAFATDDYENVRLLFRLSKKGLPTTEWLKPAADSVEMSPIEKPSMPPAPGAPHWCGPDKKVEVNGRDMSFPMCKHYGQTRYYKYSVHMLVSGKKTDIDPMIIHEPQ